MSIYATRLWFGQFGGSGWDDGCGSPWIEQGSNILPSVEDPRGGHVCVNVIPNHIVREGRTDGGPGLHDWLSLGVASENDAPMHSVILNRCHVQRLRDTLTDWLERSADVND